MSRSMMKVSTTARAVFTVFDSNDAAVTGLGDGDFTKRLAKDGANDATAVTVAEIANGRYTATFTPASTGVWYLLILQATYNLRGWEETFDVTTDGVPTVAAIQSGLATSSALATVQADTDDIQTRLPAALVSGRMDSSVGAMAADTLTAAALKADAVTEIQVGLATAAAVAALPSAADYTAARAAKLDNLDATVSSRLASAGYTAPDNSGIAAIQAKTDNLPPDPADASDIAAAFSSLSSAVAGVPVAVWAAGTRTLSSFGTLVSDVWAAVLETGFSASRLVRIIAAAVSGKSTGGPGGFTARNLGDTQDQLTGTADTDGNRTPSSFGS